MRSGFLFAIVAVFAPAAGAGGADVVLSEIMYHPLRSEVREKFDAVNRGPYLQIGDDELGEYVEVHNRGTSAADLSGFRFTEGIDYRFPAGTTLPAGGYLVVAARPEALAVRFGLKSALGPFSGRLADGGERITLRDAAGLPVDSVNYRDQHPWPLAPDDRGVSLERISSFAASAGAANWRASTARFQSIRPPLQSGERGWQFVRRRATATSNRLFLWLNGPGEWLIDEVEVRETVDGPNLIANGSFETDASGWILDGNHSGTHRTVEDFHDGSASLRIVALGAGDSEANHLEILRIRGMFPERDYTLSFWARYLSGSDALTFRLSGGGLETTVHALQAFDLAAGWSEVENPAGAMSLRDRAGNLIGGRTARWLPDELGPDQPAWTDGGERGSPGWAKSKGAAAGGPHPEYDVPPGTVISLGAAEVWWTAPADGLVTIGGGAWLIRPGGHGQTFTIRRDGQVVTEGEILSGAGGGSAKPVSFETGSGGSAALTRMVTRGSTLQFAAAPRAGGAEDLLGWRIGILFSAAATSEPEPLPPPLGGVVGLGTPGEPNSVPLTISDTNLPPLVEELAHFPEIPTSRDAVTVTAVVTDDDPLASVELETFLGSSSASTRTPLFDDGAHGDGPAGDGVYGAVLAARPSHTLVHYRVHAVDSRGASTSFPYDSDPSPTRAFCHYDHELASQLTFFDLFITPENLAKLNAAPRSPDYVDASVAIDGIAYPHVGIRYRGRGSRNHPKRPWKIHFNKDHRYRGNRVLDTMLQFPFEQWIAFRVFDSAAIQNLGADLIRLHVNGQFWGVYVAFESPNSSWLEKRGLDPTGEIYKARTVETAGQSKNSDLFHNQIVTDHDYWGTWNKKVRPLEPPVHVRELTDALNDLPEAELLPWLEARVDLEQWFRRWSLYVLMNIDDFCGHNYYLYLPGGPGGKWQTLAYDFDSGFTFSRVGPLRALYGDGGSGDNPAWQRNRFYQRVSANRTLKRMYFLTLRRVMEDVYKLEEVFPEVDRLFALSTADRALDIARWGTMRGNTSELKTVATSQRNSIRTFLNAQGLPTRTQVVGFDPPPGKYPGPLSVKLIAPAGFTAVYTLDGSDPRLSASRAVYSGPLGLAFPAVVSAAALRDPLDFSIGDWSDLTAAAYDVGEPPAVVGPFVRGDADGNGVAAGRINDAVVLIRFSFLAGPPPPCLAAGDADGNGSIEGIADPIWLLSHNFLSGPPPPAPFPLCGTSSAADDVRLGCHAALEVCR